MPGLGFATASHDMTCRVWDSTGGLLAELVGHSAIVYCVAAVDVAGEGAGEAGGVVLASGSEDNTVRLWRPSGECMQVRTWDRACSHSGKVTGTEALSGAGECMQVRGGAGGSVHEGGTWAGAGQGRAGRKCWGSGVGKGHTRDIRA